MTLAGKLKAHCPRPLRGPAEDQLPILEKEGKGGKKEQPPEGKGGKESQLLQKKGPWAGSLPQDGAPLPPPPPESKRPKKHKRKKLKKYGKNVGKALQKGCRYLVLGLQGLANAYSSPLGVAVSVATAFR